MKKGETMAALAFVAFTQHLATVLLPQATTITPASSVVRHIVDMTKELQVRTDYFGLTGLDFQPNTNNEINNIK